MDIQTVCVSVCVCASLSKVFREGGCNPGAGGGPCGGSSSGKPTNSLCVTAAEEPSCSLAAHHHHCHHGLLSALWPQCGKTHTFIKRSEKTINKTIKRQKSIIKNEVENLLINIISCFFNYSFGKL